MRLSRVFAEFGDPVAERIKYYYREHISLYGKDGIINPETGTVYVRLNEGASDYPEAARIVGSWYLPNRRHHTPPALRIEIEAAGFRVRYQDGGYGGNLICIPEII